MTKLKDWYYTRYFWLVLAATASIFLADHFVWKDIGVTGLMRETRKETYSALATIFGALLGFVITAFSIVVSLSGSHVLKLLSERGHSGAIVAGFSRTTLIIGIATLVSLSAIFVDSGACPSRTYEYLVLFFSIWAAAALAGIVLLLETIVISVSQARARRDDA